MTPSVNHPDLPDEQRHLDLTVASMLERISQLEDRERNAGADLETSLALADNAEEQAAMLGVHVHQPYFGSMSVRIGGKDFCLYIGKYPHGDFGGECSVVDWKSDVGSLFYSGELSWTTKGKGRRRPLSGTIYRKRQLDVQRKKVLSVTDLYDAAQGGDTGGREAVLIDRLSERASVGMRDVIQTLQPEQNEAMRVPVPGNLIVQGAAGSGKTTIGFHRLAWLCSEQREEERATPAHCLVLMPNQVLAHYAARVLPSLNLGGVTVTTPESWMVSFLGLEKLEVTDRSLHALLTDRDKTRRSNVWRKAKLLGSLKMLSVVQRHLTLRMHERLRGISINSLLKLGLGRELSLKLSEDLLTEALSDVVSRAPFEGYKAAFKDKVLREAYYQLSAGSASDELAIRAHLENDYAAVQRRVFGSLTPLLEVRHLLESRAALEVAGEGLLNARDIAVLLSDPLSGVPRPRRSFADVTELPLMLAVRAYMDGIGRRDGASLGLYDHIVLDEAQDYAPALYALLSRAARPGHITALGDLSQAMHGYKGLNLWDEATEALRETQLINLSRSYRSTEQISRVTAFIAQTYTRAPKSGHVERQGAEVKFVETTAEQEAAEIAHCIKEMLQAGQQSIAVVTRRFVEAERLATELQEHDVAAQPILTQAARYTGGIAILPVELAKGLEFDACVVAGANAQTYEDGPEYERRLLYVACSRALHMLACVAPGVIHPTLRAARDAQNGVHLQVVAP